MLPTKFSIKNDGPVKRIFSGDDLIGTLQPCLDKRVEAVDMLKEVEPGLFEWQREFRAKEAVCGVRLTMDFAVFLPVNYGLIPAVSYNGNPWGPGQEIKGFSFEGKPWTVAYHRVAVCGATYSESSAWSVALWAGEGFKGSCALIPGENGAGVTHRLVAPEEETPRVYSLRDEFSAPFEATLNLAEGEAYPIKAYLLVRPNPQPLTGWREMLDAAWRQHNYVHRPRYSGEELWRWGLDFARNGLWSEEGVFKGFCIGVHWSTDQQKWVRNQNIYEIGWCGQNASLANALLADYLRFGNRESLDSGLEVLDGWAAYAPLPNGLFRVHFNRILRPSATKPEIQDGCNLGAAATYFFEAAELAQKCGVERPNYLNFARKSPQITSGRHINKELQQ